MSNEANMYFYAGKLVHVGKCLQICSYFACMLIKNECDLVLKIFSI